MRKDSELELSVVMPCLNEADTLESCIRKAQRFLSEYEVAGEVVIADNGSTDGSPDIAQKCGARVVQVPTPGYGAAILGGIEAARGRFIIMGDCDESYDFSALEPFLNKLREGADLVMGNRFRGGIAPGAMPTLHKYLGNPALSGIGRVIFKSPCSDFHCGLRGFTKDAAERMNLRTTGMEFASEVVVKATLLKMRIDEVPTTLSPDGRNRAPHLRSWRDGWRHLRFMLLYSPRWLLLYPGTALFAIGLLLGLLILPGPVDIGPATLDVHTLLYAGGGILVGFQAILFAVFSKIFGITAGLLPEDPRMNRLFKYVSLEVGLAVGFALVALGSGLTIYSISTWASASFGELDYAKTMRTVIPAVVTLALGCQVIVASFVLSLMGMGRR